jgi:hypothetical protein
MKGNDDEHWQNGHRNTVVHLAFWVALGADRRLAGGHDTARELGAESFQPEQFERHLV